MLFFIDFEMKLILIAPYFLGVAGEGQFFKAVFGLAREVLKSRHAGEGLVRRFCLINENMHEAYSIDQLVGGIPDPFRLPVMEFLKHGLDEPLIFSDPVGLQLIPDHNFLVFVFIGPGFFGVHV